MYSNAVERPVSAQILPNIRGARVCANLKEYRLQAKTPPLYYTGSRINAWISQQCHPWEKNQRNRSENSKIYSSFEGCSVHLWPHLIHLSAWVFDKDSSDLKVLAVIKSRTSLWLQLRQIIIIIHLEWNTSELGSLYIKVTKKYNFLNIWASIRFSALVIDIMPQSLTKTINIHLHQDTAQL